MIWNKCAPLLLCSLLLAACGGSTSGPSQTASPTTSPHPASPTPRPGPAGLTEFALPKRGSLPSAIAVGPDGNLWFTEALSNQIGRITPAGQITEFPIPSTGQLADITAGPDGNLWFTQTISDQVGRITPAGQITEFQLSGHDTLPAGITTGPDGNLWVAERARNTIVRMTPAGQLTEFPLSKDRGPNSITAGPDGNLWFTEYIGGQIGRITPAGQLTEFPLPIQTEIIHEYDMTAGPDGNLWFTECTYHAASNAPGCQDNKIGRITPAGKITEFPLPKESSPTSITAGPDGNLWFTDCTPKADPLSLGCQDSKIGRITSTGRITEFPLPLPSSSPQDMTAGPDGNLWFTESDIGKIGRLPPPK